MELDDELFKAFQARIAADQEANRLKAEELELARRQTIAAERRQAMVDEVFTRYAGTSERINIIFDFIKSRSAQDEIWREFIDTISEHIDTLANDWSKELERILRILILLLTEHAGEEKAMAKSELRQVIQQREKQELLKQHYKNLNRLQQREAKAAGNASIDLLNQIEEVEAKIAELENED